MSPTWTEKGEALLNAYLKKAKKSSKAFIAVMGTGPGQVLFQAQASSTSKDWTTIASLFSAVDGALQALHLAAGVKAPATHATESGLWYEKQGAWIIFGSGLKQNSKDLKPIFAHLKKQPSPSKAEALKLSGRDLDASMKEQWS